MDIRELKRQKKALVKSIRNARGRITDVKDRLAAFKKAIKKLPKKDLAFYSEPIAKMALEIDVKLKQLQRCISK